MDDFRDALPRAIKLFANRLVSRMARHLENSFLNRAWFSGHFTAARTQWYDHGATCEGMQALINACAPSPEKDPEVSNHTYLNPRQAFFAWFFAVHTLFRFFGDQRFTPTDLLLSDYPPPRMRQVFLTTIAADFILNRSQRPDLGVLCRRTSFEAMAEVERAFADLSGTEKRVGGIKDSLDFTRGHAMEVARHWRETLRPKLITFAYGELSE
jgi:hypothetical protein